MHISTCAVTVLRATPSAQLAHKLCRRFPNLGRGWGQHSSASGSKFFGVLSRPLGKVRLYPGGWNFLRAHRHMFFLLFGFHKCVLMLFGLVQS